MKPFSFFESEFLKKGLFNTPLKKAGGRPGIGVLRKIPAADESIEVAPEPELVQPEPAPENDKKKPKVVLKNLAWGVDKASFNDKVLARLEADLPPELSNITRVIVQVLALTPGGAREAIDKQEAHIKEGKASCQVTVYFPQRREDGSLLSKCDFIFTAKHRDSDEAESKTLPGKQPFASKVRWDKAEEWFGTPVKLLADTCLKDGEEVSLKVATENGLAFEAKAKAGKGKLEFPWVPCLCGVSAEADGSYPDKVEYYAELSYGGEKAVPEKNFFLKVVGKTEYRTFSKDYTWGIYGVHAEFRQRIEKGAVDVRVKRSIMKAWPGIRVDMTSAGFIGTVPGCPYERHRWGRVSGRGSLPNEYHDGRKWQPMPKGFIPEPEDLTVYGFVPSGSRFVQGQWTDSVWPDTFPDYDFNQAGFVTKRKDWKKDTESRWSRKFKIRPAICNKGTGQGGCGYLLDLILELQEVNAWQSDTIAVCKGKFRSNAGCLSLDDEDINMMAHEAGHLVGMPDEYEGGALDPSIQGDGAVNGVDYDSVMGQSMNLVKKRHHSNFVEVAGSQISESLGRKITFLAGDR